MPKKSDILEVFSQLAIRDSQAGFLPYLRHVVVDSRPEARRFGLVARQWQWEWAAEVAPRLEAVTGLRPAVSGPRFFWRTLARGHDKTTGLARMVNWALRFGRRPIEIVMAAADRDQAALLSEAMRKECDLNPWLGAGLKFNRDVVTGPGGVVKILTSDAFSSAGLKPDLVIADELTHWEKIDLWDILWSAIDKIPGASAVVITNAGVKGSWQWDVKEKAKTSRLWSVYEAPGRLDTWMSEEDIEENRKLLTPSEARRLLDNQWINPAEESGYLNEADIQGCAALGRELSLMYVSKGKRGVYYWAGIDYGPKRDRTALSILHQEPSGLVVVDRLDVWQGSPEAPIQIADVRSWIMEARALFPDLHVVVDPHELEELVQDFSKHMVIDRYESRGGKANYHLAECLRSAIVNRSITWYPGAGLLPVADGQVETLEDELSALVTVPMVYGYRIDHQATKHDDRAVAIGMPLVRILTDVRPEKFILPPQVQPPPSIQAGQLRLRTSAEARGIYGMRSR